VVARRVAARRHHSLDDLKGWVEHRLEDMIWHQGRDLWADLGRLLGVQALKNADRYLGQFGTGDHPPRPADDKLQRVEDVEDALKAVLRYLRQQLHPVGAAPTANTNGAATSNPFASRSRIARGGDRRISSGEP
jgi:hypothetical protein